MLGKKKRWVLAAGLALCLFSGQAFINDEAVVAEDLPGAEVVERKSGTAVDVASADNEFGLKLRHYFGLYQWSVDHTDLFWNKLWQYAGIVAENKGEQIVVNPELMPGAKWFPDARLNYAENLLANQHQSQTALIFQNETGLVKELSYFELSQTVSQLAQALKQEGVKPGDRIAGILPNLPETVIAMLATTSLGAVWSSCSPDFGVSAVVERFSQISPKILFVSDGYYFNGKIYDRVDQIDPILSALPSVGKTVLIPYIYSDTSQLKSEITLWQNYIAHFDKTRAISYTQMRFDDPLFILYSSGTTGPPKSIVHGVGGTLLQHIKEHQLHTDIHPGDRLFYYTTCGWMMWNWLVSALASSATLILYDGSPVYPEPGSLFELVDKFQINVFGISAKYIDIIKKSSTVPKHDYQLSSLNTILSTGSPLVAEAYDYIYQAIKTDLCVSSISGGTDIISCFVLGCPILPVYRGEIQCPGLAMKVQVFDDNGQALNIDKGELVCTKPFPSMPTGFWNDPGQHKYHAAYFNHFPGVWCHGDYAAWTEHQGLIIYGRSDATLNPGGIRIGTAEIYRIVEQLDEVKESLVIGLQKKSDCMIILFVILSRNQQLSEPLKNKIKHRIKTGASPHHVPAKIIQVNDIPRTQSGKIMELAVRNIINGLPVKNRHAIANPEALEQFEFYATCLVHKP